MSFELKPTKVIRNKVLLALIGDFLNEKFYTQLRTNEQLGYIVWCQTSEQRGIGHVKFVIQSDVQCP